MEGFTCFAHAGFVIYIVDLQKTRC